MRDIFSRIICAYKHANQIYAYACRENTDFRFGNIKHAIRILAKLNVYLSFLSRKWCTRVCWIVLYLVRRTIRTLWSWDGWRRLNARWERMASSVDSSRRIICYCLSNHLVLASCNNLLNHWGFLKKSVWISSFNLHISSTVFKISQGVNAFDYNEKLNLIGTVQCVLCKFWLVFANQRIFVVNVSRK